MDTSTIQHIAIIPDGNRRWARAKGLPEIHGHKYAVTHTLPALYDELLRLQIPYCTFWAMSPENFTKRSSFEIKHLMYLIKTYIAFHLDDMHAKNISIRTIGDLSVLSKDVRDTIETAVQKTNHNTGMVFIFAINYGGRHEIVRAVSRVLITGSACTQSLFESFLDTSGVPDPDMIIRTGGEIRTSGFLAWQSAYSEFFFRDELFPDFTPLVLRECIEQFKHRKRRFGS